MNDEAKRELALFTEAVELPVGQRAAFLDRACAGDDALRHKVEKLLGAHERAGDFLEMSPNASEVEDLHTSPIGEKPGDRIGRYRLIEQIGEGGCGVVFRAEQDEPVRRAVALKILKPGMDTRSVIARFEAERQALALMDHPNIAKIFDAGATESGRPYVVMEMIRGIKITDYCDRHSLTTEERLKLFIQVCQAIQHAHQKGVIHRDIKPSNILVTATSEGAALPVVIDFGIAKATSQRLTDKTLFTASDLLIGTPAYMSPEQAALTSTAVDTRTDIYSLGVLFYELLTGSTPFDTSELLKSGLDEIRRVIREVEPPRPSTRLSTTIASGTVIVAERRNTDPQRLVRTVSGDLDWIAMKALEKDPCRRYDTATGLALDVQRFLSNETISARPPSTLYRFQKTVMRHKPLFVGIAVVTVLLVAGFIIVLTLLAREHQAYEGQQAEAAKSRQVTHFLEDMLQGVGPSVAVGRDTTMLREILDRTAERVGMGMSNQPEVEAELRTLIGQLYLDLGNYDKAEQMQHAALEINRSLHGANSAEAAASLQELGITYVRSAKAMEAEAALRPALEIRRRLFGKDNADVAATLDQLGIACMQHGKTSESETLTREALGIREKLFGRQNLKTAESLRNLSIILGNEKRWPESDAMSREVLTIRRKLLHPDDPLIATSLNDLAWVVGGYGRMDEAEALEREALAMRQKVLPPDHPDIAKSLYLVGDREIQRGHPDAAFPVLMAALSIQHKLLGADSSASLDTLRSMANALEKEGKSAEAAPIYREALASWRMRGEGETPQAFQVVEGLARTLKTEGKFSEAMQVLEESLTPFVMNQAWSANALQQRAEFEVRASKWTRAVSDITLAFQHQPDNINNFPIMAALLLRTGDQAGYEKLCRQILVSFGETTDIFHADAVAKTCLFAASTNIDLRVVNRLADFTITAGANDSGALPYFQDCKALAEYRLGHFDEAVAWAQKPLHIPGLYVHQHACAVLALADLRLGKNEEAIAMFDRGNTLAPKTMPAGIAQDPGNKWLAWLFARVQLDEAEALISSARTARK